MIQMMALADAADKENRMASPASALPPLTTPKPKDKPKHKKSTNKQRITADAWKADKVVQRMIKEKAMKDVTDLAGLGEFIERHTYPKIRPRYAHNLVYVFIPEVPGK